MRDMPLKIFLNDTEFNKMNHSFSGTVPFLYLSDDKPIKRFDFIIFADTNGRERLMHILDKEQNKIHYTSYLDFHDSGYLPLIVVLTHLAESITYIRSETSGVTRYPSTNLPIQTIYCKIHIIELCVNLLEGKVSVAKFTEQLRNLAAHDDSYFFESSEAILRQYPWTYQQPDSNKILTEKISRTLTHITECLKNGNIQTIWNLIYAVHNFPFFLYRNFVRMQPS